MITGSCIKEKGYIFKERPPEALLKVAIDQQTQCSIILIFSRKQENCGLLMLHDSRFVWLTKGISVQLRMLTV